MRLFRATQAALLAALALASGGCFFDGDASGSSPSGNSRQTVANFSGRPTVGFAADWDTLEDIEEGPRKGWKKVTSKDGKETAYFQPVKSRDGKSILSWIPFIEEDPHKARMRRWDVNRDGRLDPDEQYSEFVYASKLKQQRYLKESFANSHKRPRR